MGRKYSDDIIKKKVIIENRPKKMSIDKFGVASLQTEVFN